eukprot:3629926-Alexandrium_andersonii.AAC.1
MGCYDYTDTLRKPDGRSLLDFTIITCRTRDDRETVLQALRWNPMHTMSGTQAWGKKNIPEFQREEGAFLKMLMTAITKAVGVEKYIPLWDLNAARTLDCDDQECWIAAVRDSDELVEVDGVTKRLKLLAVPDNHDE